MLKYLDLKVSESVTLELPNGRDCTIRFLSKPRSNVARFGLDCEGVVIKRGASTAVAPTEGSQDDGLITTINESV